uniref:Uncharacterized protein n=1 Tax=Oryza barthii TaxID=65489 RepID=A0A679B9Y2_9ORYZ|nr:hypothetical protein [Oryza barthii]
MVDRDSATAPISSSISTSSTNCSCRPNLLAPASCKRRQDPGPPRRCRARRSWLSGDAACGLLRRFHPQPKPLMLLQSRRKEGFHGNDLCEPP